VEPTIIKTLGLRASLGSIGAPLHRKRAGVVPELPLK
jgi:hypothetical protein